MTRNNRTHPTLSRRAFSLGAIGSTAAAALAAACGGTNSAKNATTSVPPRLAATAAAGSAAPTTAIKRGGTLHISNGEDPPDFDVLQSATYLTQFMTAPCYNTLLKADVADATNLVPDLATKWDVTDGGKTVIFTIRDGVTFHNGDPLTADDIVYTLDRIRKPPQGIVSPRKGQLANVASFEARDSKTVVAYLSQPQPDFLYLVANPFNMIYSKKVAEPLDAAGTGMKRQIMGTGPFQLVKATEGQSYDFTRYDKYFGDQAYLDKLQFFPIKDEQERAAALQGKRIDACFFFAGQPTLAALQKTSGMVTQSRPNPVFINLIPNVKKKPFDDPRVREALSLAIDRDAFIKTVGPLAGAQYYSMGLMPPKSPYSLAPEDVKQISGYDTEPTLGGNIQANRQKAMTLLQQAGVPSGFKLVIPTRSDVPAFQSGAVNVASQLKEVGIDASVDVRDAGAFYTIETSGDFQCVVHSIAIAGEEPDQILGEAYTSFGGRNYGGWQDESLDALYRQQSMETDPAKRKDLIRQFQLQFMKTFYHINLAWVGYGAAYQSTVKGWQPLTDLYANMRLDRVWLDT